MYKKKNLLLTHSELGNKKLNEHLQIVKLISKSNKPLTIPEISDKLGLSVPTITSSISNLIEEKWIVTSGKKTTSQGRKPVQYKINNDRFYVIGLNINFKELDFIVTDINLKKIAQKNKKHFDLKNTDKCLNQIIDFIKKSINELKIDSNQILGLGVGITGRVNKSTGVSHSFFNFVAPSLKEFISKKLSIDVFLDNDTRVAGITEKEFGISKSSSYGLYVYMDQGLGMSITVNNNILLGNDGYAGEFGHMKYGMKNRTCVCGNVGCLGTEVSGYALKLDLQDELNKGTKSNFFTKGKNYEYDDIVEAANSGDFLSINLIQKQGKLLGKSLGDIINLLNPNEIVIGGKITRVGNVFLDSVKMGINSSVLPEIFNSDRVYLSQIRNKNGLLGSACLVLKNYDLI